jgi:hypothetical protein
VVRWLSAQRAHGIGRSLAREVRISEGEDLIQGIESIKRELTLLAYPRECDLLDRGSSTDRTTAAVPNGDGAAASPAKRPPAGSLAGNGSDAARPVPPPLIPGLPLVHIGFLREARAPAGWELPAELSSFFAGGSAPLALAFGSMQVYGSPWASNLLEALSSESCAKKGARILAIGASVPTHVRAWPHVCWVESAPHAAVLWRCAAVIHHGGAGTSAAAAAAGVPALVVPFLQWSDQPTFAAWIESRGAGVHLPPGRRSIEDFHAAIAAVMGDSRLRDGAAAVAEELREGSAANGRTSAAEAAMSALDAHFASLTRSEPCRVGGADATPGCDDSAAAAAGAALEQPAELRLTAMRRHSEIDQLRALRSLCGSDGTKLRSGLYCLLRDPAALPLRTYALRDAWMSALGEALAVHPLYKSDWPVRQRDIDLSLHDLPHESSLIEWWYFHAHLQVRQDRPAAAQPP